MTTHILEFGNLLVMPILPTLSLSAALHGMALASPYNPVFLLSYGRVFFQGFSCAFIGLAGTLLGYGSFFFLIHAGITGPLYLWYKLEPLLCLIGAIALSVSAVNLCEQKTVLPLDWKSLGGAEPGSSNQVSGKDALSTQISDMESRTAGSESGSSQGSPLQPGSMAGASFAFSDPFGSEGAAEPGRMGSGSGVMRSFGQVFKRYREIFFFHCFLAWSNPASLCLNSQSSIADANISLGSCFFGMVAMTNLLTISLWFLRHYRTFNVAQLLGRSNQRQIASGVGSLQLGYGGIEGQGRGLPRIPRVRNFWAFQWIPYWIIGLTVTSLSQMTWHLFVHYPLDYTQLSSIQRNFDTEVPRSVRRHDPFLRLQDMMRRYPGLKDAEFSKTQRERAYIRYNSYPLNVITRGLRMNILSWRNLSYLEREPYEIYHLQQLKNIFDMQGRSLDKALDPWRFHFSMASVTPGKPEFPAIYPKIWKNKEKGNPQFAYSRSLPLSSNSATPQVYDVQTYAGPLPGLGRDLTTVGGALVTSQNSLRLGVESSNVVIHDDLAFLVQLFMEPSDM